MALGTTSFRMRQNILSVSMAMILVVIVGVLSGEGANAAMSVLRGATRGEIPFLLPFPGNRILEEECVDNVIGIRSSDGTGDVCCSAKCPSCGGEGCSFSSISDVDASDCCVSFIRESGVYCDASLEGPCIIGAPLISSDSSTCSNGFPGIQSSEGAKNVCCSAECGRCGGRGCSDLVGGDENCCVSTIYDNGGLCSTLGAAPCIIYDDEADSWAPTETSSTSSLSGTEYFGSSSSPTPSPTEKASVLLPGYVTGTSYMGCFEETGSDPFDYRADIQSMKPSMCYDECVSKGALYMGLMGSEECACGDDNDYLDTDKTAGNCDSTCAGVDSICGGGDAFGLYEIMSISSSDAAVNSADIDGNGEIDGYAYMDCNDFDGEAPFDAVLADDNMTPEMCFEICAIVSARYFGVYAGKECGCGSNSDYIVFGGTPGTCDMSCAGDSAYSCGGTDAYDLYQLVDYNIGLDSSHDGGLLECSNGIPGVESADGSVCCAAACGTCDGSRCVGTGGCCAEYIKTKYEYCSEEMEAPCIID